MVYDSAGSKLRDITLNPSPSLSVVRAYERDGKVVVVYNQNTDPHLIYSYYSTDNFSTYGQSTFDGASYLSSRFLVGDQECQTSFSGLQEYNSDLYMACYTDTTLYLYKSTDWGASWTLAGTASGYSKGGKVFLIHQGYIYISGFISGSGSVIYKYSLSMSLQKTSNFFGTFTDCSGFVRNNKLYLFYSSPDYLLMDLDTLEFTSSYFSDGSSSVHPSITNGFMDYTTRDGEFYFLASANMTGLSSYETLVEYTYGGLFIFHIPSGRWVLMFPLYKSTSSSGTYCMCGLCEDEDGNVYFNTGDLIDNTFHNSGIYKFQRSLKKLPYQDYDYLKVKEVTP